jgi:hypothetical protein
MANPRRGAGLGAAIGLVSGVILAGPALASNCTDQVATLAARHQLESAPPAVPSGGAVGAVEADQLARSGGVIRPPPVHDQATLPAPPTGDAMPTAPGVRPHPETAPAPSLPRGVGALTASERSQAEALLSAARAAATEGDEWRCLDRLEAARRLVETESHN